MVCHIFRNGTRNWYTSNRSLHRIDGPAYITDKIIMWMRSGQRHCPNGPAVILGNGTKAWYQNDNFHREDGPAIEYASGEVQYWVNGIYFSKEDWMEYYGMCRF